MHCSLHLSMLLEGVALVQVRHSGRKNYSNELQSLCRPATILGKVDIASIPPRFRRPSPTIPYKRPGIPALPTWLQRWHRSQTMHSSLIEVARCITHKPPSPRENAWPHRWEPNSSMSWLRALNPDGNFWPHQSRHLAIPVPCISDCPSDPTTARPPAASDIDVRDEPVRGGFVVSGYEQCPYAETFLHRQMSYPFIPDSYSLSSECCSVCLLALPMPYYSRS